MALRPSNQMFAVAANVHSPSRESVVAGRPLAFPMNREYQIRFTAGLLALFTTAVITLAWINFRKEAQFSTPTDGVWWVKHGESVVADRVDMKGAAARAGIRSGDRLASVNGRTVTSAETVTREMYRAGAWSKITYSLVRASVPLDAAVVLVPADRPPDAGLRTTAFFSLEIGLSCFFGGGPRRVRRTFTFSASF